jgi:hypothetical protein
MFDDLSTSFLGRQLREGHDRSQHLAYVGRRKGWQRFEFQLLSQLRIALAIFRPLEFDNGNESECAGGQGGVVLPGEVFLSLEFISANFIFAVLDHSFNKVTTTFALRNSNALSLRKIKVSR